MSVHISLKVIILTIQGLELAEMHSLAVDYPKSGVSVHMGKDLKVQKWPHFMEKTHLSRDQTYHSYGVLGKLYDEVDLVAFQPQYELPFDSRILDAYPLEQDILDKATEIKREYDTAMRRIMAQHDIRSEFEIWTGFVMQHNFEKKNYQLQEEIGRVMAALRDGFRRLCIEKTGGSSFHTIGPLVAALYTVTANEVSAMMKHKQMTSDDKEELQTPCREPLISVPWIFMTELGFIANNMENVTEIDVQMSTAWPIEPSQQLPGVHNLPLRTQTVNTKGGGVYSRGDSITSSFDILKEQSGLSVSEKRSVPDNSHTVPIQDCEQAIQNAISLDSV
jgi:RNA-dependent RNA polymerase